MKKIEQLIKELQMLIANPEMDKIIEEKLWDTWRDAHAEATKVFVERFNRIAKNLKEGLSEEEKKRMEETHFFWEEDACHYCGISQYEMYDFPQFCNPKEEKKEA